VKTTADVVARKSRDSRGSITVTGVGDTLESGIIVSKPTNGDRVEIVIICHSYLVLFD
jgi:hypothetical protein